MPNDQIAPCKCGFLQREANRPDSPIRFDPGLNEYRFAYLKNTGQEAAIMIFHCPLCGGRASNFRRAEPFNSVSDAERHRLSNLTKNLRTVQDVATAFGEPDIRRTMGLDGGSSGAGAGSDTTKFFPVMIYTRLSDTADVHVIIFPADRVGISFQPKSLKKAAA